MHFGASLRMLRVQGGWSLRDLAAAVGVSSAYLSRVEHGHDAAPTPERLAALARTLELPADLLPRLAGRVAATPTEASLAADALHREVLRRRLTPAQVGRVLEFIEHHFPAAHPPRHATVTARLSGTRVVRGARVASLDDAMDLAALRLGAGGQAAVVAESFRRGGAAAFALGGGLLLPHTPEGAPAAALVLLATPLPAPTPDDRPIQAVLALTGVPGGAAGLTLLGHAAQLADPTLIHALAHAPDDEAVLRLLRMFEGA